jgi:hypothetical protein
MKHRTLAGFLSVAVLGSAGSGVGAEANDNPYQDIVNRNAFALKPPPPPAPPGSDQPPPSPVEVLLTGISTLGGVKKVLLQIVDKTPGKQQQPKLPPPLVEGDVEGRVEVVSIDADKGAVTIKIDGNDKTLTFEKDAPKPSAAPVPTPGLPRPALAGAPNPAGTIPLPNVTSAAGAAAALAAALPPRPVRNGQEGSGSVVVGGAAAPGVPTYNPNPAGQVQLGAGTGVTRDPLAQLEERRRLLREAAAQGLVPGARAATSPQTLVPRTLNSPAPAQ